MAFTQSVKWLAALLLVVAVLGLANSAKVPSGPVKHYIVLMMENHAFDHLLGYFKMDHFKVDGLKGHESNPWDMQDPNGKKLYATMNAKDVSPDPDHSINGTTTQIFGVPENTGHAKMNGFVASARFALGDAKAERIMEMWDPAHLPILTTLANNFVLFDAWHASVPGPTFGNRMYFHSATSHGDGYNFIPQDGWPQKTIYQLLDESDYNWAFYFDQAQDAAFFNYTRDPRFASRLKTYDQFYYDADTSNLPTLSFLTPRFFGAADIPANDQHPNHAVTLGEELIKKTYEKLRASPSWQDSAFLLTYDEHGGFYDHVPTPIHGVPNPDGLDATKPVHFNFSRLGLRVPTILISPWVDHTLVHEPKGVKPTDSSSFEHSSFIATLTKMLGLNGPLTKRDAWAAPFDYLFTRTTPRTDCPRTLPEVHPISQEYSKIKANKPEHLQPLDELHMYYLRSSNRMAGLPQDANLDQLKTEADGATYLQLLNARHQQNAKAAGY